MKYEEKKRSQEIEKIRKKNEETQLDNKVKKLQEEQVYNQQKQQNNQYKKTENILIPDAIKENNPYWDWV